MKRFACYIVFGLSLMGFSQETELSSTVNSLSAQILLSEGPEKLKLMDSLSLLIKYKTEFKFDSIVRETIDYAFSLDSIKTGTLRACDLIHYLSTFKGQPQQGVEVYKDLLTKDELPDHDRILARLHYYGGTSYGLLRELEASIEALKLAQDHYLKAGDSTGYATSKMFQSDGYRDMGHFPEATLLLQEAEAIFEQLKDTNRIALAKSSKANLFSNNGFMEEAQELRASVIEMSAPRRYYNALIPALVNAATDYQNLGDYEAEIHHLNKAVFYVRDSRFKPLFEPVLLNKLLRAYAVVDSLPKAEKVLAEIESNRAQNTAGTYEFLYLEGLGHYYLAKGDLKKALAMGNEFMGNEMAKEHYGTKLNAHELLYRIHDASGNSEDALYHFKKLHKIKDSIGTVQKAQALSYYQTLYETEKREAKIANQEAEIDLLDNKNKVKNQWIIIGGISLLSIFVIVYLYVTRRFAKRKQVMQASFSRALIKEQEQERTRLARELHDGLGQKLMLLSKRVKSMEDNGINDLTDGTLEELRSMSNGLHPIVLERFGVSKAIRSMINEVDANTDIFFTHDIEDLDQYMCGETAMHLYRLIQECLNNIIKHSQAKAASIVVEKQADTIKAIVSDNGVGFEVLDTIRAAKGLGMKTLLERAKILGSKIHIDSEIDKGTTINILTPIAVLK